MVVTHVAGAQQASQGQMQKITMDVNHVEFVGAASQLLELEGDVDQGFPDRRVQTQSCRNDRMQLCRGHGVAAREQRDVMPLPHQLFGQVRDDALGAAVELWRHTFNERCDLRDSHATPFAAVAQCRVWRGLSTTLVYSFCFSLKFR